MPGLPILASALRARAAVGEISAENGKRCALGTDAERVAAAEKLRREAGGKLRRAVLVAKPKKMRSLLLLLGLMTLAAAGPAPSCLPAIAIAERAHDIAPGLLGAIGLVESGRMDPRTRVRSPWPWTVTAEGAGTFYAGKAEAMAAVRVLQARGIRSIDVGCLQVNLLHHPEAFRDLDEAFDPANNARYAANFLAGLHRRLSTWAAAAAAYHSATPELGVPYSKLVASVWAGAAIPVINGVDGTEVVIFPGGGELRVMRDTSAGTGRIVGFLSGP